MIRFFQSSQTGVKFLIGGFIAILTISMVAYLIPNFMDSTTAAGPNGNYATVAGEAITSKQVSDTARLLMSRQQQKLPDAFLPYFFDQAANQLIIQAAFLHEAHRVGLMVTDEELRDQLKHAPELFPNGKFVGKEKYEQWVANQQMTVPDFETQVKKQILMQKYFAVLTRSVTASPSEVESEFKRVNAKAKFDYAILKQSDLAKQVIVNEPELKAYYDAHKANYIANIPERRKAHYFVVDASHFNVKITEDDYRQVYNSRIELFKKPESVDVRHILVDTEADANDVKKQLKSGAKFEELAKKLSKDPGSKDKGGQYKDVRRGAMVAEFDNAIFTQKVGEIGPPVKTKFGYHIIKVDAHHAASTMSFEEAKKLIEPGIKQTKVEKEMGELAAKVTASAKKDGIEKAAKDNGFSVINTDLFTQQDKLPALTNAPAFMQAAFAAKLNGAPDSVHYDGGYAIYQVTEIKAGERKPFSLDEARKDVVSNYQLERAKDLLTKKSQELADRAKALKDLKKAAKELDAKLLTSELVSPGGQVPEIGNLAQNIQNAPFTLAKGAVGGPFFAGDNGIVIAILEKQEPTTEEFTKQKDQFTDQLLNSKRNAMLYTYMDELKRRYEKSGQIKINKTEQERLAPKGLGF